MTEKNIAAEPQIDHLIVDENVPEFLARVAQKLEQDGEVLVQTEENVGTEKTIH